MKAKFNFYSDPSHGWLRVDRDTLTKLGLNQNCFTSFSYVDINYLYLEEDSDAKTFLKAYSEKTGKTPEIVRHYSKSPSSIRRKHFNYPVKDFAA